MMILQEAERRRLSHMLARHSFLREEALRRALLINAGLKHLLDSVTPKESASVFLHLLLAELWTNLDANQPGEPWLVSLLLYLLNSPGDADLSSEERQFLQQVVQRSTIRPPGGEEKLIQPESNAANHGSRVTTSDKMAEAEGSYLRQVIRRTELIDITGLPATVIHQSVPLDEVFIPLRFRPNRPMTEYPLTASELQEYERRLKNQLPLKDLARFIFEAERSWYATSKGDKTISIDELWQMFTPDRPAAIIQGYPGMGKSTLVKYFSLFMARRCLRQHHRPMAIQLEPALVPFMIRLEDYASRRNDEPDLSLENYLKLALDSFNIPGLTLLFQQSFNAGRSLVLLDGLDEVSDPRIRLAIQDEIKNFVYQYSDAVQQSQFNRFLITTRVAGYDQAAFPRYPHYTIAELTQEQIEAFLPRWCQAIVRMDAAFMASNGGEQTQAFQKEVALRTEELRTSIRERPELQTLAENPLLLTLLAVMQQNKIEVPRQRVELYRLFIQTLLRRRGDNAARSLPSEELVTLRLGPVAWHMQETGNGFAHKNDVMASLIQTIEQEGHYTESNGIHREAEAFLHTMRVHIGLFVFRAGDYYGFLHRTFQEYFAARYALERMANDAGTIADFIRKAHDNYGSWREPFLLAVAYASKYQENLAHEIIRTLLLTNVKQDAEGREAGLRMAAECLIEAEPFSIDARFERYIAWQLLRAYEQAQDGQRFESCEQIEDVVRRWLLSLPRKGPAATVLAVLQEALSSHKRPAYQRAALTLLAMSIEELAPLSPLVLSALFPTLLALVGLPAIGDYQPVPGLSASTDLAAADLALTTLSLSGVHGPGGMLVQSAQRHFAAHPEQLRVLARYSLESRVLLTPTMIPKKDEGSIEWPGDISLRRWHFLLDQHRGGQITGSEIESCLSIHQELLRAAEEMRYPFTLHLLNILALAEKSPRQSWRDICQRYLSSQLNAGHYTGYQECAFFWCTLFPEEQYLQQLVSLLRDHLECNAQPVQRYALRFLATLTDVLLALDDLQAIGDADGPEGVFLHYLRYWLDIRGIRPSMQDPREVRYLRFLRDMHTLQNLHTVQGEEALQHPPYLQKLQDALFTHDLTEKVLAHIAAVSGDQSECNDLLTILLGWLCHIQNSDEKGKAIELQLQQIARVICTRGDLLENDEGLAIALDIIHRLPARSVQEIECLAQLARATAHEKIRAACLSTLNNAPSGTTDAIKEHLSQLPALNAVESRKKPGEEISDVPTFLLEIYEHSTPSLTVQERKNGKQQIAQAEGIPSFDVCIICALAEEARAFIRVLTEQSNAQFERGYSKRKRFGYRYATIQNDRGEPLTIHVSWLSSYGPLEAGLHLTAVLEECKPRFAAMTGICAGDKDAVHLGDIVIAERTFTYDNGKFTLDGHSRRVYLHNTITYQPKTEVLQFAHMFDQWESAVASVRRRSRSKRQQREWLLQKLLETTGRVDEINKKELKRYAPAWRQLVSELQEGDNCYLSAEMTLLNPARVQVLHYGKQEFPFKDPPRSECLIKPMASGSAVRADHPFSSVQIPVRGAVAIDMEGAAFYRILANFPDIHALLVKGVSDFADGDKDDSYHAYAASVSAAYLLSFIKEYVTQERLPVISAYSGVGNFVIER
jgi:nucleoside phosphorylase